MNSIEFPREYSSLLAFLGPTATFEVDPNIKLLADSAPVLLWLSSIDSRCVFFNDQWLQFTGRSLEQEVGYGWAEGMHHEDLQRCLDTYLEHFRVRKEFEMTYRLRRADGEYRWILDRGRPYFRADGSFGGFIGSCVDITEQMLFEEKQKKQNAELEHRNQMQSAFITMLTHELKTPLAAIKGGLGIVLDGVDGPLNEDQIQTLELVKDNISRLKNLINNVLDFQKFEAGYDGLEMSPNDINEIAMEAAGLFEPAVADSGLVFSLESLEEPIVIPCDAERIKQVIFNLLDNATKFTSSPGKITLRVRHDEEGTVSFDVEDSGIGIGLEQQGNIFEMFKQSGSKLQWNKDGFGVGLAICRKIVDLHHGTIKVVSELGKGTRFTVTLPASQQQ